MSDLPADVSRLVWSAMAKDLIEKLSPEQQSALLHESMTRMFGEYRFKAAVEQALADRAMSVARQMIASPEWTDRIRREIRTGLDMYLNRLAGATADMLTEVFHGTDGSYANHGAVLKYLNAFKKKD